MSIDRREFLGSAGLGFGRLALSYLLGSQLSPGATIANPLAAKAPPLPATAKNVIFLFMHGGPSHLDSFDPKPALVKLEGKPVPASFGSVQLQFSKFNEVPILASRRTFKKYGQGGTEISDLFPKVAEHADDLAVIRSCYHDGFTHTAAKPCSRASMHSRSISPRVASALRAVNPGSMSTAIGVNASAALNVP